MTYGLARMSNLANPKARKGTNPERKPAKANKGQSTTPAVPPCVLCGDTITPDDENTPSHLINEGRCCLDCDIRLIVALLKVPKRVGEYVALIGDFKKGGAK